jgi:hypothetical protein
MMIFCCCGGGAGANAPRATQDKSLSRLAVLSLFIVNHILTHFKVLHATQLSHLCLDVCSDTRHTPHALAQDRVMDAVDERGDTALHRLAEMRRITTLMAVSSQASLIVRGPSSRISPQMNRTLNNTTRNTTRNATRHDTTNDTHTVMAIVDA